MSSMKGRIMKNKKLFIFLILFFLSIIISIFLKNAYKTSKTGNTIIKSSNDLAEYILNINSYEAEIEMQVNSNKNISKYVIKQKYTEPNIFKQEVLEPSNIQGVTITHDGNNIKLENTKLNLTKIYENYEYLADNFLDLKFFIEKYKEKDDSEYEEKENEIIMKTNIENNEYIQKARLYVSKESKVPTKLELMDKNEKNIVYILYKEIKINNLAKEDVLAFYLEKTKTNM